MRYLNLKSSLTKSSFAFKITILHRISRFTRESNWDSLTRNYLLESITNMLKSQL